MNKLVVPDGEGDQQESPSFEDIFTVNNVISAKGSIASGNVSPWNRKETKIERMQRRISKIERFKFSIYE